MKYFHELSVEEKKKLADSGTTWQDVINNYKQPDWCDYPEALRGELGCWSLILIDKSIVCKDFCSNCDCFKQKETESGL